MLIFEEAFVEGGPLRRPFEPHFLESFNLFAVVQHCDASEDGKIGLNVYAFVANMVQQNLYNLSMPDARFCLESGLILA